MAQHLDRVEIARHLLGRGVDPGAQVPSFAVLEPMVEAAAAAATPPHSRAGSRQLPEADVVVISWTASGPRSSAR